MQTISPQDSVYEITGVIIYPEEDLNATSQLDSIPQDVIFIPGDLDNIKNDQPGYWMYFQSIRWTQKDLKFILANSKKMDATMEHVHSPRFVFFDNGVTRSKLIRGKIVLNKLRTKSAFIDKNEYTLNLTIDGRTYLIRYKDFPAEFGVPITFIPLD